MSFSVNKWKDFKRFYWVLDEASFDEIIFDRLKKNLIICWKIVFIDCKALVIADRLFSFSVIRFVDFRLDTVSICYDLCILHSHTSSFSSLLLFFLLFFLFFLYVHIYLHFHSVLSRFRYHYLCLFIFFRNKQTVFLTLYLSFSFSLTVVNASLEIQVTNNETHQIERYIGKKTKKTIFYRSIKDIWLFLSF